MAKEISEELKNYNKYPGEQVISLPEDQIKVGTKSFHLVKNFKEGFNSLALEQRYGHVFDKFDYIVGDWGHELLRLRGFYENSRKQVEAEERIDHLADYLQEYCAYGCAYFVLRRERAEGEIDEPFVADKEDLLQPKKPRPRVVSERGKNQPFRDRQFRQERTDDGFSTVRPDSGNRSKVKENQKQHPKHTNKTNNVKPKSNKSKFTMRERKD